MNRWAIGIILVAFIGFCCAFNAATPYRQGGFLFHQRGKDGGHAHVPDVGAPDERQHANYIAHLKDGKGFPVLVPGSPDLGETYQSHQPPLYYLLGTGWSSITGADPTQQSGGFMLRLLNTFIGCGGLLGIYFAAKWGGFKEPVALASMAIAAFLPMNIALHSAVSNDPLLYALCAWGLAFTARGLVQGENMVSAYAAGTCFGLAVLTKTTGMALLPVLLTGAVVALKGKEKGWFNWLGAIGWGLLLTLPWLIRNENLYGDPFAIKAFNAAFPGSPQASGFIESVGITAYLTQWVGWWTARSFVGVFGYMDIFLFETVKQQVSDMVYNMSWLVFVVLGLGPVLAPKLGKPSQPDKLEKPLHFWAPALVLAVVVVVLFLRFNMQYFQGQARYLYPGLSVFAIAVGSGAVAWSKDKGSYTWIFIAIALGLLDIAALSQIGEGFHARLG